MDDQGSSRRLSAILIADIAGYTKLVEQDTDGTVAELKSVRSSVINPSIARLHGRIVKHTGDGFLAEFQSVQDAVNCAIEMQTGLRTSSLKFRMAVNLGDVIDDGEDIYGEGVNIAARLETLADPGGISISGGVFDQIRNRVQANFEDLGEHEVKHVSAPVHVYKIEVSISEAIQKDKLSDMSTLTDKPSIAVLPFDNMSGDPEQEFFADGMAEDIITSLSRYRSLFVIARNSTFAYKDTSFNLNEVAKALGVRYLVEGSVRKSGSRIRVTAQLIEGATNIHIWAEKYDRTIEDIFALQDEITEAIVSAISPEIDQAERDRAKRLPPENLDAWELYQRGLWHLYRFTAEDNTEAQALFVRANKIAPDFSPAMSALTHALYYEYMHGYTDKNRSTLLTDAFSLSRNAIAADERDADAHFAIGRILYLKQELEASKAEFETAISLNPNFSHAYLGLGGALVFNGEFSRCIEVCDHALRLSPKDPIHWLFLTVKGMALLCSGEYQLAADALQHATRQPTSAWTAYLVLGSAFGHIGRSEQALVAIDHVLSKKPDLNINHLKEIFPFESIDHFEIVLEGLRATNSNFVKN